MTRKPIGSDPKHCVNLGASKVAKPVDSSAPFQTEIKMNMTSFQNTAIAFLLTFIAGSFAQQTCHAQTDQEAALIAILQSDAPEAEKAITCKHLAVHGTAHAVPELAKLLPDPKLTSWARTALEVIPDDSADEALRSALTNLETGRPLIGVINSIATRGDTAAVPALVERLQSDHPEVRIAAAVALGKIGDAPAQQALENGLAKLATESNPGIAEGCILVAEQQYDRGDLAAAATLYTKVREAQVAKQRMLEATRGLILAQNSAELLSEQLQSEDKDHFGLGLRTARELPGQEITDALVQALDNAETKRQSMIVLSLAERDRDSVLPAILRLAGSGNSNARKNAFLVLGNVGNASTVDTLLDGASDADGEVAESAKDALAALTDPAVDAAIKLRLSEAKGSTRTAIIETIGARRIDAISDLLIAADDEDPKVRSAALTALGATVGPDNLTELVQRFTNPKHATDQGTALKALTTASTRMPDRDACAIHLTTAMKNQPLETQAALIAILGNVGGSQALQTVAASANHEQDALKDAASKTLGKWMTPDAAPVLLELAQPKANGKYQIRALRGYLRIARQMQLSPAERAKMCEQALQSAGRDQERALALRVLEIHPSLDSLAVAIKAKQTPAIQDAAHQTSLRVAKSLPGQAAEVAAILEQGGLKPAKIEILRATYGTGDQSKDVTEHLQRNVGQLPIISLPSASYNTAFEGDPAPGVVKQLTVEYKIDGNQGEASFPENAAIILPTP